MPADTRLYLHFEGKIKDAQFEEYNKFINDIRESASKAGSDFGVQLQMGKGLSITKHLPMKKISNRLNLVR